MISRVFTENTLNSPAYFLNQLTFVTSQTSSVSWSLPACFALAEALAATADSDQLLRYVVQEKNSSNDKIFKSLRSRSEWYWEIVEPEALGSWRWPWIPCKSSGKSRETNHMWQNTQVSPLYKSDCPLSLSCGWTKSLLFAIKKDLITTYLISWVLMLWIHFCEI